MDENIKKYYKERTDKSWHLLFLFFRRGWFKEPNVILKYLSPNEKEHAFRNCLLST